MEFSIGDKVHFTGTTSDLFKGEVIAKDSDGRLLIRFTPGNVFSRVNLSDWCSERWMYPNGIAKVYTNERKEK